ncbi:MAG: hypothetical protein HY542_06145 [Deltaproteobacteria bacterium]|nr:hypothetical protein [Deltaproteobacteria bacterium]
MLLRSWALPLILLFTFPSCFWLPTSKGTDLSPDVSADSSTECDSGETDDSLPSASLSSWNSSLVLSDGSSIATSREIKLTLSARNDRKISYYYLSEEPTEPKSGSDGWVEVTETNDLELSSVSFQLSENDGEKTIDGWFKDSCGEISPVASLKITLDTAIPVGTMVLAGGSASTNSLSVSVKMAGSVVGNTPIVSYFISETNETPAADSTVWNTITNPSSGVVVETNFSLSARSGEHTVYGWFKSQTGRVSEVISQKITFSLPTVAGGAAPVVEEGLTVGSGSTVTASLSINGGSLFTNSQSVSVSISGLSSANINGYELSESATPASYTSISSPSSSLTLTPAYTLSPGDGLKTVYLHIRDSVGTTATASGSITLDTVAPTGTLKLDNGNKLTVDAGISANITGSDSTGIVGYYLSSSSTVPGANDSGWTAITSTTSLATAPDRTLTDLTGLSTQYLWLKDAAGNVSATISDGIEVVRVFAQTTLNDIGRYSSIVVDSQGNPFISAYRAISENLGRISFRDGSFVYSDIDTFGNVGAGTSIAIDSNDKLHIAYRDTTNGTLKYFTDASGSWATETIEAGGISPSIGVDSTGKVHISHQASNKVRYVTNVSGSWVSQVALENDSYSAVSALTVDVNGKIHVVGAGLSGVGYATNLSGTLTPEIAVTGSNNSTTILTDDSGIRYIAFRQNGPLALATNSGNGWTTEQLDSVSSALPSIGIDSDSFLHICYYDSTINDLKYATDYSGSWTTVTLDSSGDVGNYCDIAIDSNDRLHISYYDATNGNGDLKYATTAD